MLAIEGLSDGQIDILARTERINSAFSLAGIFFVMGTYGFSRYFDKPINRLIFFASFGNLGSDIAAIMSDRGPAAGATSATCQVQAFLVQM